MARKKIRKLRTGDADQRRLKLIDASRSRDPAYVPQLLERLRTESSQANRRHIVRAIGNIGGLEAEAVLLALADGETGLILGDIATALGQLQCRRAVPKLKRLITSEIPWVAQQASFALKRIRESD